MSSLKKVLIMAGGTGGHVFPALAVAKQLIQQGVVVEWLGVPGRLEATVVPGAGIDLHCIAVKGLRNAGIWAKISAPWHLMFAVYQAGRILYRLKPDVVLGFGGYVSGPGGLASWLLRYPLVIHEQNAKLGLTNRILAWFAAKRLQAFPQTFAARYQAITVGNPVREDIATLVSPMERLALRPIDQAWRLLVIGGSLGADIFNKSLPLALAQLPLAQRPQIWHQTGEKHAEVTQDAYRQAEVAAKTESFITNMAEAYAWADVVVSRAGALAISELCAAGLGAILVPYPYAADDHQTCNAAYMVDNGAARLVPQAAFTLEKLGVLLQTLAVAQTRLAMAQAAYRLRNVTATQHVVMICKEIYQ